MVLIFTSVSALQGDPRTLTLRFTHQPQIPSPHLECFLPAILSVCVRGLCFPGEGEGPTSCVKLPLTFLTLPQSAWLDLFFANSCSFSLSSSLYGGLCQLSEAQNPDSFHELNMILKNTTLYCHTHTLFKDRGLVRTSSWQ